MDTLTEIVALRASRDKLEAQLFAMTGARDGFKATARELKEKLYQAKREARRWQEKFEAVTAPQAQAEPEPADIDWWGD